MFFKRKTGGVEWLIVGLGNPGKKYDGTRHNIGFEALDHAAAKWDIPVRKSRFDALVGEGAVNGTKVLLVKPQTFMNLSGTAVQRAAAYYKLPPEKVLVLFDDVSLAPGILRIRRQGSAGGHNGLKSLITFIGEEFPRIKIGVGEKPRPEYNLADWVLSRFTADEKKVVTARFDDVTAAAEFILRGDFTAAMSRYNGEGKS